MVIRFLPSISEQKQGQATFLKGRSIFLYCHSILLPLLGAKNGQTEQTSKCRKPLSTQAQSRVAKRGKKNVFDFGCDGIRDFIS
jgi:hypothetical protein